MSIQLQAINFVLQIIVLIVALVLLSGLWLKLHPNPLISRLLLCKILLISTLLLRRIDDVGALGGVDIISNEIFFVLSWVSVLAVGTVAWLLFHDYGRHLLREQRRARRIEQLESLRAKEGW